MFLWSQIARQQFYLIILFTISRKQISHYEQKKNIFHSSVQYFKTVFISHSAQKTENFAMKYLTRFLYSKAKINILNHFPLQFLQTPQGSSANNATPQNYFKFQSTGQKSVQLYFFKTQLFRNGITTFQFQIENHKIISITTKQYTMVLVYLLKRYFQLVPRLKTYFVITKKVVKNTFQN